MSEFSQRAKAREICAKLLPHTTSVQNIDIVESALDAERDATLEEAARVVEMSGIMVPSSYIIRALKGKRG